MTSPVTSAGCRRRWRHAGAVTAVVLAAVAAWSLRPLGAQRGGMFLGSLTDPAIAYATAPTDTVVDALNRRLADGSARLAFDGRSGYLASVLEALALPVDSQLLLFSKGSLQGRLIGPANPRALFFDDRVALGWVRDADLLEVAVHDARAGVVFYTLEQTPRDRPQFAREFRCLGCHLTGDTLGVPGLLMFSSTPDGDDERHVTAVMRDHRDPLAERFGGWFVTGAPAAAGHRGNRVPALAAHAAGRLDSTAGLYDPDGFRAASSDVAALLVLSHQAHLTNLLTRAAWDARVLDPALHPGAAAATSPEALATFMRAIAEEVVDYLLFVDEAPLPAPVHGGSAFAARMSARGPHDRRGRSLYQLDLERRLLRYPCSYLIYSPAFEALPALVKAPIYQRLWDVLSGAVTSPRYAAALSPGDRRAIVEILGDTKTDLPPYFAAGRR
ncbi:MAG: hypothetical protein AB7U83_15755 [Vicinamibacterales bacterium]